MVGASCCVSNCRRYRCKIKYPHLSFFNINRVGNSEWTAKLVHCVDRCDKGFKVKSAKICAVHFKEECIILGM